MEQNILEVSLVEMEIASLLCIFLGCFVFGMETKRTNFCAKVKSLLVKIEGD